ncbi:hypothetical protein [Natrinema sp. H-ect4]|uniref:hypothetical protein n=1 Tax=Natrinema sp. H-ect4 TaxID=3242699 RepID=UPI0035A8B01C
MTARKLESHADVVSAAVNIYFNGDLDPEAVETELDALVDRARRNGVDISVDELMEQLDTRENADRDAVSYSWVHLNEFRLFELHDRCFPWSIPEELRDVTDELPK